MIIYSKVVIDMLSGEILEQVGSEYRGPVALCKGPTSEQKDLQRKQAAAYDQAMSESAQRFGEQSAIFKELQAATKPYLDAGPNQAGIAPEVQKAMIAASFGKAREQIVKNFKALDDQFAPILAKGVGQFGYTPQEEAALRTDAFEQGSGIYKMSAEAAAERDAAGGGGAFVPSGARAQSQAQLVAKISADEMAAQRQITEQGAAIGRQNFMTAASVLGHEADTLTGLDTQTAQATFGLSDESIKLGQQRFDTALNVRAGEAGLQNPTGYMNAATSAGSAASQTASDIEKAQGEAGQLWAGIAGSAMGMAGQIGMGKCWIARELWGVCSYKAETFRLWLNERAPQHLFGYLFNWFYCRFGERIAEHIKTHRLSRKLVSGIMEAVYPYAAQEVDESWLKAF